MRQLWTKENLDQLRVLAQVYTAREMVPMTGRSFHGIKGMARRQGISLKANPDKRRRVYSLARAKVRRPILTPAPARYRHPHVDTMMAIVERTSTRRRP